MMTLTRGAGAFAVSPVIQLHGIVGRCSPAFKLLRRVVEGTRWGWDETSETLGTIIVDLLKLFREKKAAPTDRLDEDGSTILHVSSASPQLRYTVGGYILLSTLFIDDGRLI
jgi:hypothetical protein